MLRQVISAKAGRVVGLDQREAHLVKLGEVTVPVVQMIEYPKLQDRLPR